MKALILCALLFFVKAWAQYEIYDSGGPLMPEQAAYDVSFYDLQLTVNPNDSTVEGSNTIRARIVQPIDFFVVDLDTLLSIPKISEIVDGKERAASFHREDGKVWINLNRTRQPGESVSIKVYYGGRPLIANRPPWDGGFTWTKTADGSPWIATTCQGEGPDILWPIKDHISDKADSAHIRVRVPDPLICASNGKLLSVVKHEDHTSTFDWFVSTPINNYTIALNIAPYKLIEQDYKSTSGDVFPVKFWVLPEDYEKGVKFFPEIIAHLNFFERTLGPYPFRRDKYGVVQTPHLGMEHQSITAYGANFDNGAMTAGIDYGFDALLHHEMSHEWWGNLVTNADWKDSWIHEGFGTYMQVLYMEELKGMQGYHYYLSNNRNFSEEYAIAPHESKTTEEIWKAPIYAKGAWVLSTLRYLIGEKAIRLVLRRMAYPDPDMEKRDDGSYVRFATTSDFKYMVKKISGKDLDWFFDVYMHQPILPAISADIKSNVLTLKWITPEHLRFPMPVDVKNGDKIRRVEIPQAGVEIEIDPSKEIVIDPDKWVLLKPYGIDQAKQMLSESNYKKAEVYLKNCLLVDSGLVRAKNALQHISFMKSADPKSIQKTFENFCGRYRLNENWNYAVTKTDSGFYIESRRAKYQAYPVSDNKYITIDSDIIFHFNSDDQGGPKSLDVITTRRTFSAKFVDKITDQTL